MLSTIALCVIIAFGWCNAVLAEENAKRDAIPQLVVRGEATLHVPADQLRLNIGVITNAETADLALAQNNAKMKQVEEAIKNTGLTKEEYQTGQFQIQPRWAPHPPRKAAKDWRPEIVGYTVTNSLRIRTTYPIEMYAS